MTSPISGLIAWPVIGYVAIVGVGRLLFTRNTISDQLVNRSLLWGLSGLVLFRCTQTTSIGSVANQLALGCIVMFVMHLYGLARLWEPGADPAVAWRRQRIYSAVGVVAAVLTLIAGPAAAGAERLPDPNPNWGGLVVWAAQGTPVAAATLVQTRLALRELRRENRRPLAKVVGSLMLLAYVPTYVALVLMVGETVLGWEVGYSPVGRAEIAFTFAAVLATALVAGPVVGHLLEFAGVDRDGRICRRLRPLWRDVTAAVPEIVMFPAGDGLTRRDTTARLLRMTVEIRDALLHLGPYLPPTHTGSPAPRQDVSEPQLRDYAHRLAQAAGARQAGATPSNTGLVQQPFPPAQDFDTELRQLLDLARVWSSARATPKVSPPVGTVGTCALGD
ncbi:MAB_1171c family putative transporter [Nocardia sp. NPDC052316]|uniref:MAB_1171c family putative transporter n=1 Tax=Nocardia sp. NPDC052316 TaxID=3364329 RepID=UPI0037CAC922